MERGAALILAVLITVILALLGIAFLFMAETENRIARNEKRAAQALYLAEVAARAVKRWFDDPRGALQFPPLAAVDRTRREIIDPGDPYGPAGATPADGVLGSLPFYKQAVDRDGDAIEDLFERPYRGDLRHALSGTEDGPDMLIDRRDPVAAAYLDRLSARLLSGFPYEPGGVRARIRSIAVFAPPYVETGAGWSRAGMGTVLVVAGLYHPAHGRMIAERRVRMVLGEIPYRGAYGPLHSCGPLTLTGNPFPVHWGTVTAASETRLSEVSSLPLGLPRAIPVDARSEALWDTGDPAGFEARYKGPIEDGRRWLPDPWLRIFSRDRISAPTVPGLPQPYTAVIPDAPPPECCDHSNLFQGIPVPCPEYGYETWTSIAGSGERQVRYFIWTGAGFSENGVGVPRSFQSLTDRGEGIFFFDTADRLPPRDDDGDGIADNLTPAIRLRGDWSFRGFLYLNARRLQFENVAGRPVSLHPPGEPYLDLDRDGDRDAGEPWINLDYGSLGTPRGAVRAIADGSSRLDRGPALAGLVSYQGILYTSGAFEATGHGVLYGSLIAAGGVVQAVDDGSAPTPDLYWDPSITGEWPPPGWDLPRVTVTSWSSDR